MTNPSEDLDQLAVAAGDPEMVQQVFDQMPLLLVAVDGRDMRILAATAAFRMWTGRPDVVGQSARDTFPEIAGQQIFPILERVQRTGQPESLREFRLQFDLPDTGEQLELYVDFNANPLRTEDGNVACVVIDIVDITERVKERQAAQQRAAEAELRYEQARDVIGVLQRELLPAGVPILPRVQIGASYLLADADTAAGGDWFDAVPLAGGRVALVVGDVVGHGVAASASMGQLRVLLHEYLVATQDVLKTLTALDAAARRVRGAHAATVCIVLIDPLTGDVEYCTAGHPPPLVLTNSGEPRYLPHTGARPIGVDGQPFTRETIGWDRLAEGDLVLLYTDGILERPGRQPSQSTVELAQASADIAAGRAFRDPNRSVVERVCTQTLELLVRVTGHSDDITLLAGQLVPAPAPLRVHKVATHAASAAVRQELDTWFGQARIDPADAHRLRHAVGELLANVSDHAFVNSPGDHDFDLQVSLTDSGQLQAQVVDQGSWREPQDSQHRGLGLHMVANLVDELTIDHENGTTATVSLQVSSPAHLLNSKDFMGQLPPALPQSQSLLILEQPSAPSLRIRVDGAIDAQSVPEFDRAIRTSGMAGTRTLTVDLTGVTHLASAGVTTLYQLLALHTENGSTLRLYAPAGCPADMILSLVQISHETRDPDYPEQP